MASNRITTFDQRMPLRRDVRTTTTRSRSRRRAVILTACILVLALLYAVAQFADEPLRRRIEAGVNASLKGYTVRLPGLDFRPWDLGITLVGLRLSQNAHPNPPMLVIDELKAGLHWRALLHLRLVADFVFDRPRMHIDLKQFEQEAKDPTPVEKKGWQEALEQIYPLKVNRFEIRDGEITYVDTQTSDKPVQIKRLELLATNIRNVKSPDQKYPSTFHVDAVMFRKGHFTADGRADFLAEPQPGFRGTIDLRGVPLQDLKPVTEHANVTINGGILGAKGDFESGPKVERFALKQVTIDKLKVDYTHAPQTAAAESQRIEAVENKTKEVSGKPQASYGIEVLKIRDAEVGYIDKTANPNYRVFLNDANVELRGLSNHADAGPAHVTVTGKFMDSGDAKFDATFLPRSDHPEITADLQVVNTDLTRLNDLLLNYANLDVNSGQFSLYTQVKIENGQIDGYVKPLFSGLDVYDRRKDRGKPIFHQIYEAAVGGISTLLENPRDTVATQATAKGEADKPNVSTWQIIVNLLRNAFIKSILPGFQQAVGEHLGSAQQ